MHNVFGKCMENIRNRITMELVTSSKKTHRYMIKPKFKDRTMYSNTLMAMHKQNIKIIFDKPIYSYVGFAVSDISKICMYDSIIM